MKKLWMIYDTKYGNNAILAHAIKKQLEKDFEVRIGNAQETKPRIVVADRPYALIIGGPIRFGRPSLTINRWIKNFGKTLLKSNYCPEKAEIYCTAFGDPEKVSLIYNLARQKKIAKEIDPNSTALLVEELKGPFKNHEIQKFIDHILHFF